MNGTAYYDIVRAMADLTIDKHERGITMLYRFGMLPTCTNNFYDGDQIFGRFPQMVWNGWKESIRKYIFPKSQQKPLRNYRSPDLLRAAWTGNWLAMRLLLEGVGILGPDGDEPLAICNWMVDCLQNTDFKRDWRVIGKKIWQYSACKRLLEQALAKTNRVCRRSSRAR